MRSRISDAFASYHPITNFIYFTAVIGFSMVLRQPTVQLISLACALFYAVQAEGKKAVLLSLKFSLPMIILTAIINPAFNHEGVTILTYLPSGNPLTLESIYYGISAGILLATVFTWFVSFNRVITSDKFIYLFGRIIPALSLVLSMTLRFVPKFKAQLSEITMAQRGLGNDISKGNVLSRIKTAIIILSSLITWSLENGIESADSMKSRGYGLKGRTAFSIYTFTKRDIIMLVWLLICTAYTLVGCFTSAFAFNYFPMMSSINISALSLSFQIMYFALCITPVIINASEDKKWKSLYSRM